jgi:integrase
MPINLEMTWVPKGRRWTKKYRGTWYAVSCRRLGTPPTKESSWRAANDWWANQQRSIDNAPPSEEELRANAIRVWSMVQDWTVLDGQSRERIVDSLVGVGQYQKIKAQADAMIASAMRAPPPERTVKHQVVSWKRLLRGVCQSGQMSEGRYDAYCRNIAVFMDWIGEQSSIDAINEAKLEEFFNHLAQQVVARNYAPSYAHTLLMTAKQFISHLAELKLIPLPANVRSRRFRFNHTAPIKIETFTVAEVRQMLTAAEELSERTKLYLLLMLNCGMYQNDIAELRNEEVNWQIGTITRARSKTRERHGQVVTYKLWPETFSLLRKYRNRGDLALTNEEGKPLVRYWLDEEGKLKRYDCVHAAWSKLPPRLGLNRMRLALKHLRKTASTTLGQHPQYKFYANHFLADSPRNIADRSYVVPSQDEFFSALDWLRGQLLGA